MVGELDDGPLRTMVEKPRVTRVFLEIVEFFKVKMWKKVWK